MKKLLIVFLVCLMYTVGLARGISGSGGSGGIPDGFALLGSVCNVNAGGDDAYCISEDSFTLYGSVSSPTNPFPSSYSWSLLPGAPSTVTIVSPNSLTTGVIGPFAIGTYQFSFCAMCEDSTTQCDTVNIIVSPLVTQAIITDTFGVPILSNPLEACTSFKVFGNSPAVGENANWGFLTYYPDYNQVIAGNSCTGTIGASPYCVNQTVYYNISNGGCNSYDSVRVLFYRQQEPVSIIGPYYDSSRYCGNAIGLQATVAGCTGFSQWTLLSMPPGAITPVMSNPNYYYNYTTFSTTGWYTYMYSVDSSGPCPSGSDTVTFYICISNINGLGGYTNIYYCDSFPDTFYLHSNWDPTFVYEPWTHYSDGIGTDSVLNHVPADTGATAYLLATNASYHQFCQRALAGFCIDGQDTNLCYSYRCITLWREMTFAVDADTVNLFCGGVQGFSVWNNISYTGSSYAYIRPRVVPPGSSIDTHQIFSYNQTFDLQIPGQYVFMVYTVSPSGNICSDTTLLYVNVSSLENPSAGTSVIDSICNVDTIIVVGNLPINQYTGMVDPNAVVLWQQISGPNTLTFTNSANSQLLGLTGFVPGTYQMVYSFSLDPSCYLADTMTITLYPCDTLPPPDSCISIVQDSMWCDGSGVFMHFCIRNNLGNTWNLNSFQFVTPPGVSISSISQPAGSGFVALIPQYYYFYNLPATPPGSTLCDFVVQVSGAAAGSTQCFYAIGHDEDTIPSSNCCLDSSNFVCLTVPTCRDTCGYVTDSIYCIDGVLYYAYTIHNIANFTIDGYRIYMTPPPGGVAINTSAVTIPPMTSYTGTPIDLTSYGLTPGSTACFYAKLYSTHLMGGVPCIDTTCWTDTNCYTVPECSPCCGYWGTISYTAYPPGGGLPVSQITTCGSTIPYNCPREDIRISNMYNFQYFCGRTCGDASFTAVMYDPANTSIWTGSSTGSFWSINGNLIPWGADGTYRLVVYAYCNGHLCDSCVLLIRKDCDDCCGRWGTISYTSYPAGGGLPVSRIIDCGATIPYNCPRLLNNYNFQYNCSGTCATSFRSTLYSPSNASIWTGTNVGTFWSIDGNTLPFGVNGTYRLVVYAYCGDHLCDSCVVFIRKDCADCCGRWGTVAFTYYPPGGAPVMRITSCGATVPYNCPRLDNFYTFQYNCTGTCATSFRAAMYNPSNVSIWTSTSTGSTWNIDGNLIPFTVNGTYRLVVYAYCGDHLCDSCVLYVRKDCADCCGRWGTMSYTAYPTPGGLPVSRIIDCGAVIPYNCPPLLNNYNFQYFCNSTTCTASFTSTLYNPSNTSVWTGSSTGSYWSINGNTLPFTVNGTYRLVVYAYCDGRLCDSCIITIRRDCAVDCCGEWGHVGYSDDRTGNEYTPYVCGSEIRHDCGDDLWIYNDYFCRTPCGTSMETHVFDPSGNDIASYSVTGNNLTWTIPGANFTTSGMYRIVTYAYCGGVICDSCVLNVYVECPECCGEWGPTYYQGYDSKGDPVSIRFDCGATIPYNCPPLSNVYTFTYYCARPCLPTYQATLFNEAGMVVWTGTFTGNIYNISALPIMSNGVFTLHVEVYCGGSYCNRCDIRIEAHCHFPECCGEWASNYIDDFSDPHGPVSRRFECGTSIKVDCIHNYHILFNYICRDECPTSYHCVLDAPDGSVSTYTYTGSSLDYVTNFTMTGTYRLHVYVYCGGMLCGECVIYLDADCGKKREARTTETTIAKATDAIQVFPNPLQDFLSISTINEAIQLVEVYDLQGNLVFTKAFTEELRNATLDLSTVSSGTYILRINKSIQKKISIIK